MHRLLGVRLSNDQAQRRVVLLRRTLAAFAITLVALTWRLWIPQQLFPQVPWFRAILLVPAWTQWAPLAVMVAGLCGALVAPGQGRSGQIALLVFVAGMLASVLFDQERLQPWAYQFTLVALVLALADARRAIALVSLLVISFYFYSAVTKFDYSFLHTLGQQFLGALAQTIGLSLDRWSDPARVLAAGVFPTGELLVAVGLCFRPTRGVALGGAIALHLLLIVILGPWGLDHRPGVLAWNLYFIVQDLVLFVGATAGGASNAEGDVALPAPTAGGRFAAAVIFAAVALPLLSRSGWFDLWPGWGLDASSAERTVLYLHRRAAEQLPADLQPFVETPDGDEDPWTVLRLDRWSLAALGAPVYPQNRYQLALAEAVVERFQLSHRARVVLFGVAARLTGERAHETLSGQAQIDEAARRYFFNAAPNQQAFRPSAATATGEHPGDRLIESYFDGATFGPATLVSVSKADFGFMTASRNPITSRPHTVIPLLQQANAPCPCWCE